MSLSEDEVHRTADRLFAAFVAHDYPAARAMLAEGFRGWGNLQGVEMDADGFLAVLPLMREQVGLHRYEDVRRMVTAAGFVEQHWVRVTRPDDRDLDFGDACVVVRLDGDGRVVRIDEYIDTAHVRRVLRELAQ